MSRYLQAPCILHIGQEYRYSPEHTVYIFSQQIYLIIFLYFLSPSSCIPPQNVFYFLMLPFLVHKIFTFYINGVLNCKCPDTFRHHASYIQDRRTATPQSTLFVHLVNKYFYFFLDFLSPSSFIPPQNVFYLLMLHFLVHNTFTVYINGVLNCKSPAPWPKS